MRTVVFVGAGSCAPGPSALQARVYRHVTGGRRRTWEENGWAAGTSATGVRGNMLGVGSRRSGTPEGGGGLTT